MSCQVCGAPLECMTCWANENPVTAPSPSTAAALEALEHLGLLLGSTEAPNQDIAEVLREAMYRIDSIRAALAAGPGREP